jgi:geranylgeranyl pyrophosphate synthase
MAQLHLITLKDTVMTTSAMTVEHTVSKVRQSKTQTSRGADGAAAAANQAIDLVKEQLDQVEATMLHLPDIEPLALRKAVEDIVSSGGKRIRPTIALLIAALFNNHTRRAIDLASAVEMLHTATLVHDDLIDGSLMRRGTSTLNAMWTPAATVLTGDYLFAIAAGLAARTESVRTMNIFSETLGMIVAGELRQQFTDWTKRGTREDYYARIYAKTASMFILATTAAGVISDANEDQIAALATYGRNFGLAFQIVDDILDFTGEQANVGKPVGSDLRNGLITLPTICYSESHPDDTEIDCALRGECDSQTYDTLIMRIRTSDAIAFALDEAAGLVHTAKQTLLSFPDTEYRSALMEIANYTIERDK